MANGDPVHRKKMLGKLKMHALKSPIPRRGPYLCVLSHVALEEDKDLLCGLLMDTLNGCGHMDPVLIGACRLIRAIEPRGELVSLLSDRIEEKMIV